MIVWGTGGDEGSAFETLKDMFYNPDGYNCLGFDNIWDETATTNKCGFFVPQYTNPVSYTHLDVYKRQC